MATFGWAANNRRSAVHRTDHRGVSDNGTSVNGEGGPWFGFTFGSQLADAIKIRKKFDRFPLRLTLGIDLDLRARDVACKAHVKDMLIKAKWSVDAGTKRVQIRKTFALPTGGVVMASCGANLRGLAGGSFAPSFSVQYALAAPMEVGHARLGLTDAGIDWRHKVPTPSKHLKLQVCGNLKLPLPVAKFSPASEDNASMQFGIEQEGKLHLHIAQINPVIYI